MARKSLIEILNGKTKFGRLEVLREGEGIPVPGNGKMRTLICRCDCGDERSYHLQNVKTGKSISCGCFRREHSSKSKITHGEGGGIGTPGVTPEYRVWSHMIGRCENPNDGAYHNYGGRGISVCATWRNDYMSFLSDMGRRPSPNHSIDRIDNDGNYEPGNCQWAVKATQSRNVRYNRWIEFRGDRLVLKDMAEKYGIKRQALECRLRRGWSVDDALTKPVAGIKS